MRNTFWLLLVLGAGLAFLSSRRDSTFCQACSLATAIPNLSTFLFHPVTLDLPYPAPPSPENWRPLTPTQRLADARERLLPSLPQELAKHEATLGDAAFIRVFKESKELELWLRTDSTWTLFRNYPIAVFSGKLGPKIKEGDGQAPEGFYSITQKSLNPASNYHLSFNIGYPNAYDQHHGRTGSLIMVHGAEVSIGCFAMTDPVIEEIYLIVEAALAKGQSAVPIHIFPFRMTADRMAQVWDEKALPFWQELKPGYDAFENDRSPPSISMKEGRYAFQP